MRIRDYTVTDSSKVSSDLLNQVTGDFSNAMAEAYMELEALKRRNSAFKTAVHQSMSHLIQTANALTTAQTGLKITAYNPPISSTGIQLDHSYGQLTLEESNRTTHLPTVEDNYGRFLAINSVEVYVGKTETSFGASTLARVVVDDEGEIWAQEFAPADTDSGALWIKVVTPVIGRTPNFVSVYPLSGTRVDTVKVKRLGGYTEYSPASFWPVKLHTNFSDFDRDVRVKLTGVLQDNGNYLFSLKKIDIYSVVYASQGTFTYRTQDVFDSITSVTVNSPYFYPSGSQTTDMIQVKVLTDDGLTTLYDSFLSNEAFTVPAGPAHVLVQVTLYQTGGSTPFFRTAV